MASNIRTDIPASPVAYTEDLRRNFEVIKQEIELMQGFINAGSFADSPVFTGTIHGDNAELLGTLTVPTIAPTSTQTPTLTVAAPLSNLIGGPTFTKMPDGVVHVSGDLTFDYTTMDTQMATVSAGNGQLCALGALRAEFRPSVDHINMVMLTTSGFFAVIRVYTTGRVTLGWGIDRSTSNSAVTGSGHVLHISGSYRP